MGMFGNANSETASDASRDITTMEFIEKAITSIISVSLCHEDAGMRAYVLECCDVFALLFRHFDQSYFSDFPNLSDLVTEIANFCLSLLGYV